MKMGKLDWREIRMPAETRQWAIARPRLEWLVAVPGNGVLCCDWRHELEPDGFNLVGSVESVEIL